MSDVDWVKERGACTARAMFEALARDIARDIETRNELRFNGDAYHFQLEKQDPFTYYVLRSGAGLKPQLVKFALAKNEIAIASSPGSDFKLDVTATVTLTDKGVCCFVIDNEQLEPWQLRKRMLERLFFYVYGEWL